MLHFGMFGITVWLWLLGFLLAGCVAWFACDFIKRTARRRRRRAYYARAGAQTAPQPLASRPAPLSGRSMSPAHAAAIRADAEHCAQRDWTAGVTSATNGHDPGTPEFVLWYASYQLHLGELAEKAEAEAASGQEHEKP